MESAPRQIAGVFHTYTPLADCLAERTRDQWSVNWLNHLGRQGMTRRMVIVTLTKSVYFHSALIAPYLAL